MNLGTTTKGISKHFGPHFGTVFMAGFSNENSKYVKCMCIYAAKTLKLINYDDISCTGHGYIVVS